MESMQDKPKARIMVVEDEALVARELSIRLGRMKYEVVATCGTPELALSSAAALAPDLILMDINLNADKDGIDIAGEIHETQDIPIIFCTAYSSNDVLERAKITTPFGYILKPIDSRELEITIEIALYKHGVDHKLHDTANKLKVALDSIEDAVISCDQNGKIFLANPKAIELCKFDFVPIGRMITDMLCFVDLNTGIDNVDIDAWLQEKQNCHHQNNYLLKNYNEGTVPVELNVASLEDKNGLYNGLIFAFRDISRRISFEEQLKKNAIQDPITGLPERSMMFERLKLALKRAKLDDDYSFAVIFIDLDRFRVINDGLNHEFGDEVLRRVSQKVLDQLRDIDMLSRFSSDTFVCLLDNVDSMPKILSVVNRIQSEIALPMAINTHQITVTASSGIVLSNKKYNNYETYSDILRDADTAMYQAKLKGGNIHVIFDKQMHDYALRLLWIEEELLDAIEAGDIQVYYQPIVDANSHEITSFEALVRWIHPEKGFIAPDEFIPIAEETGLILPLGEFILHSVCQQLCRWNNEMGFNTKVGVNLSARQFSQPHLAELIISTIEKYQLKTSFIGVEVTETMAMTDVDTATAILNSLRKIGVKVSLDDFGTGYSSLSYLKKLPVHTLKIDRSFITELEHNVDDQAIVKAIVAMTQELEFNVLVEGVENKEQVAILQKLGCAYFQGYYFAKPMNAYDATQLLRGIDKGFIPAELPFYPDQLEMPSCASDSVL
ncbi:EAL domain-containing protein [Thalassomonas haliotis]|uniref:EAL domain-containing protein n=1 Tax=Thalassomonas haliotis TaxID=485448 RepID=A0ABY7V9Q8_9GAMM|nr:EAL domain-containing protein [Thalassomonas haliotis]WDE10087.1 EAL domain-containing protein [Thalassomonas haliotis]